MVTFATPTIIIDFSDGFSERIKKKTSNNVFPLQTWVRFHKAASSQKLA